jgi:hypothetical protein
VAVAQIVLKSENQTEFTSITFDDGFKISGNSVLTGVVIRNCEG